MPSQIEWTDETWNPVRGCSIVSAGCTNCYAMKQAHRFSGTGGPYEGLTQISKGGPVWTGKIRLVPELLDRPLRWRRPRRIFVNSMSDLFHPDVPENFIDEVFVAMAAGQRHRFQILTKRPERMRDYIAELAPGGEVDPERWDLARRHIWAIAGGISAHEQERIGVMLAHPRWPLPNVALGVSVENQVTAQERIHPLLDTPAAVRWISAEPLLGPVSFRWASWHDYYSPGWRERGETQNHLGGLRGLDWIVAGGESGPGARPMHPDWPRAIRDQCVEAGVPFFFKQWGAWAPAPPLQPATHGIFPDGSVYRAGHCMGASTKEARQIARRHAGQEWERLWKPGKKAAGRELDGEVWDQMPEIFRHSSGTERGG